MALDPFQPDPHTLPGAVRTAARELPRWRGLTQLWVREQFSEPVTAETLDRLVEVALEAVRTASHPADFRPQDVEPSTLAECRHRYFERLLRLGGIRVRHLRSVWRFLERHEDYRDGTTLGLLVDHDAADSELKATIARAVVAGGAFGSPPRMIPTNELIRRASWRRTPAVREALVGAEQCWIVEPLLQDDLEVDRRACFRRFAEVAPDRALVMAEEDRRGCRSWLGPEDIVPLLRTEDAGHRSRAMALLPEVGDGAEVGCRRPAARDST